MKFLPLITILFQLSVSLRVLTFWGGVYVKGFYLLLYTVSHRTIWAFTSQFAGLSIQDLLLFICCYCFCRTINIFCTVRYYSEVQWWHIFTSLNHFFNSKDAHFWVCICFLVMAYFLLFGLHQFFKIYRCSDLLGVVLTFVKFMNSNDWLS